mmetsp:Transcript_37298/g.61496  ORF Transcript_37298/g.61496 Transcript_37298/m.61496 type:complete len:105 (+) Transcript_37298:296-610(+)
MMILQHQCSRKYTCEWYNIYWACKKMAGAFIMMGSKSALFIICCGGKITKKQDTFLFLATLHHLIGAECSCICICVCTIFCVHVVVVHVLLWGFLSFSNIFLYF